VFALALRIGFASATVTKMQAIIWRATFGLQNDLAIWRSATSDGQDSLGSRTRAQEVAQSVRQTLNRDMRGMGRHNPNNGAPSRAPSVGSGRGTNETNPNIPLGRSYPAPTRRVSSQALKRKPAS
jgi:hypothetical protein